MEDRINHLSHKFINLTEVDVRLDAISFREDIKASLGQTMHTEEIQDTIKIIEIEQDMILEIEVVMGIIQEAIQGMEGIIIIEEVVIEIKITINIGVGHMKDRIEMGELEDSTSASNSRLRSGSRASTNRDRIRCLNVENMIISQGNDQLGKQVRK